MSLSNVGIKSFATKLVETAAHSIECRNVDIEPKDALEICHAVQTELGTKDISSTPASHENTCWDVSQFDAIKKQVYRYANLLIQKATNEDN